MRKTRLHTAQGASSKWPCEQLINLSQVMPKCVGSQILKDNLLRCWRDLGTAKGIKGRNSVCQDDNQEKKEEKNPMTKEVESTKNTQVN